MVARIIQERMRERERMTIRKRERMKKRKLEQVKEKVRERERSERKIYIHL